LARGAFLLAGQIEAQTAATLFFHLLLQRAAAQAAAMILTLAQMAGLAAAVLMQLVVPAPEYQGKDLQAEQVIMAALQRITQAAVAGLRVLEGQQQPHP